MHLNNRDLVLLAALARRHAMQELQRDQRFETFDRGVGHGGELMDEDEWQTAWDDFLTGFWRGFFRTLWLMAKVVLALFFLVWLGVLIFGGE